MDETKDIAGVIAPPPLIFGVPLIAGLAFHELVGGFDFTVRDLPWLVRAAMGPGFVIFGAFMIAGAILAFRRADTPAEPWEPTRALTFKGPYRLTRNPMYLGMAAIYFGLSVLAGCYLLLAILAPILIVIDRFVIAREERYLSAKFGSDYDDYRARSRRWL
ncbi:methyltransferase family protein [Sphingomicrobium sediminis]|uniref:Isoprenylcysteine carboxylmethyltransferase family protein n=1 Tax=Sphingomicrobium sediminis TaxID=2950949 RepID=A0A9X2ELK2_9SPHN|nr:isoprenylcysteine carboxylmethyltransferase family protein [Sphingomicrobium sediminis]MCM8557594.1 isoprenylcysteine carboxylmethyltransferase family protein [Sphingomicrobium sediminis]